MPVNGASYDPDDRTVHGDPYLRHLRLRDEAPVSYNAEHDFYALARYVDVRTALADSETFSPKRK
jgi:hypothetical protein